MLGRNLQGLFDSIGVYPMLQYPDKFSGHKTRSYTFRVHRRCFDSRHFNDKMTIVGRVASCAAEALNLSPGGFVDRKQQGTPLAQVQGTLTLNAPKRMLALEVFCTFCGVERRTKRPLGRNSPVRMLLSCRIQCPRPYAFFRGKLEIESMEID